MVELADLTKRQREILDFIRSYLAEHGYPPSVRDIGKAVGLTSSSTVHQHLSNLEKIGVIRRDPTKPRALELLDRAVQGVRDGVKGVISGGSAPGIPLVGDVAAGSPIVAEENIEEYVPVPQVAGGDTADYLLRVRGDSMEKIGILDGDHVVVKSQQTAQDGEIVVALVEGSEATVKRFFHEGDRVKLQPENDSLEPIYTDQVDVVGRVVGVLRTL